LTVLYSNGGMIRLLYLAHLSYRICKIHWHWYQHKIFHNT